MKSYKPVVIERIFSLLYDFELGELKRTVVVSSDIQDAKRYCNDNLGTNIKVDANPFNFMKDIVRGKKAGAFWPESVRQLGWTGQQKTGGGAVFEFVPVTEEVPDGLVLDIRPTEQTPEFPVQSLSLSLGSKALGRADESWLLQVCVNLRIIETHMAVGASKQLDPSEIMHLQMDIKLRRVQIDALFLALSIGDLHHRPRETLLTIEAKQENQRILPEQISRQVIAAFESSGVDTVIPIAVAALRGKGVYVVEFEIVHRKDLSKFELPKFHRDAIYKLMPPVKGISSSK